MPPPPTASGDTVAPSAAGDVYGVGVVLACVLTLSPQLDGGPAGIRAHLEAAMANGDPYVRELYPLVLACTGQDSGHGTKCRTPSMGHVYTQLRSLL